MVMFCGTPSCFGLGDGRLQRDHRAVMREFQKRSGDGSLSLCHA